MLLLSNIASTEFDVNKTGLFEGSFFWGGGGWVGQIDFPSYFKKNLSNINMTLYNY